MKVVNAPSPPDTTTAILRAFGEAVTYRVTIPGIGTFNNDNPSGNREWEQFLISTTTDDPSIADAMAISIPLSGTYIINVEDLDMVNLFALNPPFPVRGEVINNPLAPPPLPPLPPEVPMSTVPTLSEWGLITMVLGFGLIAFFAIRKRNLVKN